MASLFNPDDNQQMIERIEKLTPETTALWGRMTVDQMLRHCAAPVDVATGKLTLKMPVLLGLLGRMLKKKVLRKGLDKNSPTAREFVFRDRSDFETAQHELIERYRMLANNRAYITVLKHPFWGKMSYEDWDRLLWMHLDHHLRQFGV